MTPKRTMSLIRPTLDTPFHVDFAWWQENDRDWKLFLRRLLCEEHQQLLAGTAHDEVIDWVDPETAEVHPVDALQHVVMTHCALQPGFLQSNVPMVESIFRVLLASGNTPMTSVELGERLNRQPQLILRTLSGPRVYYGIRPVQE